MAVVSPGRLDYYVSPKKLPGALIEVAEARARVPLVYLTYIEEDRAEHWNRYQSSREVLISTETSYKTAVTRARQRTRIRVISFEERATRLLFLLRHKYDDASFPSVVPRSAFRRLRVVTGTTTEPTYWRSLTRSLAVQRV